MDKIISNNAVANQKPQHYFFGYSLLILLIAEM